MTIHNFYNITGTVLNYKIRTYNTTLKYIVLRKNKQGKYYIAYHLVDDIWSEHPFHKILKWPSKTQKEEFGDIQTFSTETDARVVMKRILKHSSNYPRQFVLSDCMMGLGLAALLAFALLVYALIHQ